MALSNRQRVENALELLNNGLRAFFEREMKSVYGAAWEKRAVASLEKPLVKGNWDVSAIITVMLAEWHNVFKRTLGQAERSYIGEVRELRNRWAHMSAFNASDADRALDTIERLLMSVSASAEAAEVKKQKIELRRLSDEEAAKRDVAKAAAAPIESVGTPSGLKPWREVIFPHEDVQKGKYQQAEFAADLAQVYRGEGSDEYRDPMQFFQRTFITEGLKSLLSGALQRLNGTGGDPVIELQTNFGGGKTHSMIALYHFLGGANAGKLHGIETVLEAAGTDKLVKANRAVLVGTDLPLSEPHKKKDGTIVHTIWGELAWQLLKRDGYELVAAADRQGVSPGAGALRDLFTLAEPCVVLIDEWVAHARQLVGKSDLPAGTFDSTFSFAQELTEAARALKKTLIVASIPSSDIEIGGEAGKEALTRLKNVFGRMQSPWRPASAEESFEIVRRRLFRQMDADGFRQRDAVIRAFMDWYNTNKAEFPAGTSEGDYRRRMEASYPLHPELFDRLYDDWSSLERFQRTRGVLRLMASVVHALWTRDDRSLLIMPSSVTLDDSNTLNELMLYVEDALRPIIEREVDGPNSLPLRLDKENPNFGRYSAARRVARTVYFGTAPRLRTAQKGIEDKRIILGCSQPNESVATFRDALRRIADRASHLYVNENRYWFDTQPSINRVAQDRADNCKPDMVFKEIEDRLRVEAKQRGEFERVQVVENAGQSGDVPDEREVRLVIIGPESPFSKGSGGGAMTVAQTILEQRGNSPRTFKNALIFLAADQKNLESLQQAVRTYLAWKSVSDEKETLNLDPFQSKQVDTKLKDAESTVRARIPETYQWLLVPEQELRGPMTWREVKLQPSPEAVAVRASKKLINDGLLIADRFGGVLLRRELDRVPLWRGDHVSVQQLVDDFATYVYLQRLKNSDVLLRSIEDGAGSITWEQEGFAYAGYHNEDEQKYMGLRYSPRLAPQADRTGVVLKSDVARNQIDAEAAAQSSSPTYAEPQPIGGKVANGTAPQAPTTPAAPSRPKRFYASVDLDALRFGKEAGQISEAVIQHLTALMKSKVKVTLEIEAEVSDGVPENVQRTVSENCRTLGIKNFDFEER